MAVMVAVAVASKINKQMLLLPQSQPGGKQSVSKSSIDDAQKQQSQE